MPSYLEHPEFLERSFGSQNNKNQTVSKGEIDDVNG